MATQKIFAQHNSRIDLSSLGNNDQVQVVISGPDLKLTSPQGSVTIVNGALYSSLKESELSVQFKDGTVRGKDLLGQVNLENIDFKSADSFLVDQVQNKELQEEQEALKQKMRQAEKDKEEAEKAKEAAEKARAQAEKAALEAQEAQKSSQQIEQTLNDFLTQANTKAALAQITPDERDISLDSASSLHKESSATIEVAQVNKNTNRSSGLNNPAPNPKIDLKISFGLDDNSNTSGQKDNLTKVTLPTLIGSTLPGTQVIIQKKDGLILNTTKADSSGNFAFTLDKSLDEGPHEFMALGEYKGNKAQAELSLVIKSIIKPVDFQMNQKDIALKSENPDIFLIKNVEPTIEGTAEENTQVSIYNKKSTADKETRLGTVSVDEKGGWSYPFKDRQLAQGNNTISVVAEDKAKNIAAAKKTINLDSIPPDAPTIELAEGSEPVIDDDGQTFTRFTTPTLEGTLEAGAKIELYLNGKKITEDISVAEGKWSFKPKKKLAAQEHTIKGVAIDERGNRSDERTEENKQGHGEFTFTIDDNVNISRFNAKIVDDDNTSLKVEDNKNHKITSNTNPRFEGEGKPNSTIIFSNNENNSGKQVQVKVDEQGKWSLPGFKNPSKDGPNHLKFDITDLYNNKDEFEFAYEIDTIPPVPPNQISLKENFKTIGTKNTQTTAEKQPTLKGKGEPFSWVWIYEDPGLDSGSNNMGKYLDRVKVEGNGYWEYTFPASLTPKLHTLKFKAQDAANNLSGAANFEFNVQTEATILEAYLSKESRSNIALNWKTKKTGNLTIEGKADSQANITIDIQGQSLSQNNVVANKEGYWNINIGDLSEGKYSVKITSTSEVKGIEPLNINPDLWIKTRIETARIEIIEEDGLVSKRGDQIITSNTKPRFKITGEAGSEVTVIFKRNKTEAKKEVTGKMSQSGDFIVENLDLENDLYDVHVELKDDVENRSQLSSPYKFTIDTDGINPTIELENSTAFHGESNKNITKDNIFQFKGQAAPEALISLRRHDEGSNVDIIIKNNILATELNGVWEAEYSASDDSLKDGEYTFSVQSDYLKTKLDSAQLTVILDRETQIGKIELVQTLDDQTLRPGATKSQKPAFKITVPDDVRQIELWAVEESKKRNNKNKFTFTKKNATITDSDKNRIWEMTLGSDLEADKAYTLHVEVTDHASNKKNNWDDESQPYPFYISGDLTKPSIFFDDKTKTGESFYFTKKTEKLGFIVSNVKIVEGQNPPTVQVEIKSLQLQEEGDSKNITATQRKGKKWEAVTEKNTSFSKGKYQATVKVSDFNKAKASNTFDFHVKPFIKLTEIELVNENTLEKSFVKTNKSLTLTYNTPKFNIKFDKEDIHSVNIELKYSDNNVIENKQLNQQEMIKGEYSYGPGTLSNQKDYILTVTATDKAGNQSPEAQNFNINTSELEEVHIELNEKDKTGDKNSNFTKNKNPTLILKTQEDNIDQIKLFKKGEDGTDQEIKTLKSSGGFENNKDEHWQIPDKFFEKDGKYTITAKPYKGRKEGPTTEIDINFYQNAPEVEKIQLNTESKSTFEESGIYTNKSTPGFLITVPDGDQQRVWKMQVLVINKSDEKPLEKIEIKDNLFQSSNTQPVPTKQKWSKGEYDIAVKLTDKAGNASTQKTQTIYFDDTQPEPVITFAPEASPQNSDDKYIIKNTQRTFVIKGTGKKPIEASDYIEVTLTQSNKTFSPKLYNSKTNKGLFSYKKEKEEQTFSLVDDEESIWPKGDFKLSVKVTDRYGNTGSSQQALSFTIQDSIETPDISLIDDDETSYDKTPGVHITNKSQPRFQLSHLDEHATRVAIKTTPPVAGASTSDDNFDHLANNNEEKNRLKKAFELQKEWTDNGDYHLSVNTFVDEEPSADAKLKVLFDNKLKQPQITLDDETRESASSATSGATVASKTPKFNLSDIDSDVKKVLLQVYENTNKKPVETIEFDIKDFDDTTKSEDIEKKGIKRTNNNQYTYQPIKWADKANYTISLTVTDHAKNSNATKPATFEVNIDTAIAKIPSITLGNSDNHTFNKGKKSFTKSQNPSFELSNIDDRAETITITLFKGSTTEVLASKTLNKDDKTFNFNDLILTDKSALSSLQDGQYTITAKVKLSTNMLSDPGTLVFTVDHADAPTPIIELVGNTGTNDKPVTNKTRPKFNIKNIALDRLDWDNPKSIEVTFEKKNSKDELVTQNLTESEINDNTVEFTANNTLEPGEYTVTANVTYQAGRVGRGQLNDGMTIYTAKPESTIEFLDELNEGLNKVGDQFKVRQDQMKFNIIIKNLDNIPNKQGEFKVLVHLKDEKDVKVDVEAVQNSGNSSIWTADFNKKTLSAKNYTVTAKVIDPHGNEGDSSNQLQVSVIDKLTQPEIQMVDEYNTPYDGEKKKGEATTHKEKPRFNISNIDDAANQVTVTLKKNGEENSAIVKTITKEKGPFKESDFKEIEVSLINGDGDYTVTVEASNNDIKSSSALTVKFYGTVFTPEISLINQPGENGKSVLSEDLKPTFKIEKVDPHAREINITATPEKSEETEKKFQAVLNKDGSIKSMPNGHHFEKLNDGSGYRFTPGEKWAEGKYNIVVSVINEARQPSLDSSPLGLLISTSGLQSLDIRLNDEDKTGDKNSNFTKNKKPRLILKTQEDNIDKIEIYKKFEDKNNENIYTLRSVQGFKPNKDEHWQIPDNIFDKEGKYTITAKPYKLVKEGPTTEIDINFYQNAPEVEKIQLNTESKSTFEESGIYTNKSTPGFLITVPDGDQQRVWKMQVLVINKSDEKPLEKIEIKDNLFQSSNTEPVPTKQKWSKGEYDISVTLTDKAGNASKQTTQKIYFDDTEPEPVIVFASEAPPNKSGGKNIIKNQNRKFVIKGTNEKPINESDEIEVTLTQTQIDKNFSPKLYNSKTNKGFFSYDAKSKEQRLSLDKTEILPKGDFQLNVKVTDRYGNTGSSQQALSFTIQDSVEKPEISLIDDDETSYKKENGVHITNKSQPRFKLSHLDEHATRVAIKTTPPVAGASTSDDNFDHLANNNEEKNRLKKAFELQKEWTDNGDYHLSVNTFVDEEPSADETLKVLFDNELNQPQITLDAETEKSSSAAYSGATVASKTPKFNLSDIDSDVKKVLLQVYENTNKKPVETIEFDIKDFDDTTKSEDIEKKGIKRTNNNQYTYQPIKWADKANYTISLTVTDHAKNSNATKPATFEVNIDTAIAKIPSITLGNSDNHTFNKGKKSFTKSQNPSFELSNIDDRAETITITLFKGSTTEVLASKTLNKDDKTFNFNDLILTDKSALSSLQDGQYTITAKVKLSTNMLSDPGTLVFTVDHADAPTPIIELVGNTGTNDKPVTNKTRPKFNIKNIALDRLDWDNPKSIEVTFEKKNSKDELVTQNLTESEINDNTVEFTANNTLEPGEYTVTANVTYQAGRVGRGQLNDGMTIYTTPPTSAIAFENPRKVSSEDGKNKVQKQDLKFKISVNDDTAMLKKGSSKVKVSLKKGDVKEGPEIEALYNNTENVWKVDLSEKSIPKGDYTIEANVTDSHGNTGISQPKRFYMLDGLLKPEIEIGASDHTPYDPAEYTDNKKITNNNKPTFIIKNIDPEAESVAFSVSKKGVDTPFATRNYKKNEGGWPFFSNTEKIKVEFQDDGDYEIKLDVVGVGGVQESAKVLTLTLNAQVDTPQISLQSQKDVVTPLTSETKPTFLIEQIGEHVREIKIIRESQGKDPVKKEFKCKISDTGEVQNLNHHFEGTLTKVKTNPGTYTFTPDDPWPDGTYNVRVEVTNRARKSAISNEDKILALTIDNSLPEVPNIELDPLHNNTYPDSLKKTETWTNTKTPKFNITVKRNDVNQVTKVHVKVKDPRGNENIEEATKKDGKWTFTPGTPFTKGAYKLSVQSENQLERTSHFSSDITVHFNADPPRRPEITLDSESITGIDNPTDITNKPSPKLSITNINTIQDAVDPKAVEVTLINDSTNKALATNAIANYDSKNNTFFYVQRNLSQGDYTATVKATNKAGIPSEISAPLKFKIDTTPPEKPTIELPTESFIDHSSSGVRKKVAKDPSQLVFLIKTAEEINDPKYIEVSLDGNTLNKSGLNSKVVKGAFTWARLYDKKVWKFTYNIPLSAKDNYQLSVKIEDKAGNPATTTSELFRILPDLPTPTIEMTNSTSLDKANYPNLTKNKEVLFDIRLPAFKAEDVKKLEVSLDNKTWKVISNPNTGTWKYKTNSLTDGRHTLYVQVTDIRDKNKTTEQNFVVDTTILQPIIQMVKTEKDETTPEGKTIFKRKTPSFKFLNIPQDIYEITVTLDKNTVVIDKNEILKNSESGSTYTWTPTADLSRGEHTIKVAYRDLASNEKHSEEQSFEVDLQTINYAVLHPDTKEDLTALRKLKSLNDYRNYQVKILIKADAKENETIIAKDKFGNKLGEVKVSAGSKSFQMTTDKFDSTEGFQLYIKDEKNTETLFAEQKLNRAPQDIKLIFKDKGNTLSLQGFIEQGTRLIIAEKDKKIAHTNFIENGYFNVDIPVSKITELSDLVLLTEDKQKNQGHLIYPIKTAEDEGRRYPENQYGILSWSNDEWNSYILKSSSKYDLNRTGRIEIRGYNPSDRNTSVQINTWLEDKNLFVSGGVYQTIKNNVEDTGRDDDIARTRLFLKMWDREEIELLRFISKESFEQFQRYLNKDEIFYYQGSETIGTIPPKDSDPARSKRSLPLEEESAKEGKDENLPEPTPIASKAPESHQPHTHGATKEAQAQEGIAQLIRTEEPQAIEADSLKKESLPLLQPVDFNAPAPVGHPDSEPSPEAKADDTPDKEQAQQTSDAPLPSAAMEELDEQDDAEPPQNPIELNNLIESEENTTADLTPSFTLNAPKEAPDAVKAVVTLDNRPEYELELIDNQGVFTVEIPLAEGPHQLKVKFIDPDGDWIRLDKTFTIDASSERILSSMETPDRYQSDLSTGSKTSPSKENADILMMTPVLHLPEHEEESMYYS